MGQWTGARGRLAGLALTVAVAIGAAAPERAGAQTLAEALSEAYVNSGLLEQNRALLRAADEDVAQAVAGLRPVLNWSTSIRRQFGERRGPTGVVGNFVTEQASAGVNLEWLLYDSGRSQFQREAAKESVLATREGLVSIEQQVLLGAVQAFMNLRRATDTVSLRENNVRVIRRQLRAARDRFEVGEVTRTDVAQAEAALSAARANLARAEGELEQARETYARDVGSEPGTLAEPGDVPRSVGSADEAQARAVREHPDLRQAQREITVNELGVAAARAGMRPRVTLQGGYNVTSDFDEDESLGTGEISLQAGGPIYRGGELSSLVRQAQARRDAARGNLHVVRKRLAQEAGAAWSRLEVARAAREASRRQIEAAEVAFEGVQEEARLGARTTLDVLEAEQNLLDARTDLVSATTDEYIAAYALFAATGRMTAQDLGLSVPRYDPAEYYNLVKTAPVPQSAQGRALDRVLESIGAE
ncbi:TolC family outer membrane protein [Rhodosalinus sp.]|uniref:TolC family outer membrane protein n=1 Tax=Rhodosalinus sp. TaxID=2047741 RepID=UPI0035637B0C